jgi:tol-pal system protein YbgF
MTLVNFKRVLAVTVLSSMVSGAFADDAAAPVYDVDNYPPQFDAPPDPASSPAPAAQSDLQPQMQSQHQEADEVSAPPVSQPSSLTLEQRMRRVEQQVNNSQQATNSSKVDALQAQVQTLRGQVEELTHQLQQLQTQQRAMFTDIDKRLSKSPAANEATALASADTASQPLPAAEDKVAKVDAPVAKKPSVAKAPSVSSSAVPLVKPATSAATPSLTKTMTDNQPNVAEEQQIYQTAYDLIKAKKYNEAVAALQKMLQKYPSGQFAANAHYWLGELYGLLNKNELSAQEFSTVVNDYPDSPKIADAQLKVGLIYSGQFKWVDAKAAFKKVINRYPGTSSARLAAEQLKQIKIAGH